jgi:hypothetical protein
MVDVPNAEIKARAPNVIGGIEGEGGELTVAVIPQDLPAH